MIDVSGLTLVMRLPFDSVNTNGLAIVRLNMKTWQKWIDEAVSEGRVAVVMDASGNVIYSTDSRFPR